MEKMTIRDKSRLIIGYIETDSNGDRTARDFAGRIVGRYIKSRDVTTDFSGRTLWYGDMVACCLVLRVDS